MSYLPPRFLPVRLAWRALRHFAVERYLKDLPRRLLEDYEAGGPYTAPQVEATIVRHRFSRAFIPYAQVLFCDADEVTEAWRETAPRLDYGLVRRWLGDVFFRGDADFTPADVDHWADYATRWPNDPTGQRWSSILGMR